MARNRLVGEQRGVTKTIPALELQAIQLGVKYSIDLFKDLSDSTCLLPINIRDITLFSDSLVCLSWLDSYVNKLDKMQGRSVFVMNKLEEIEKICTFHSIKFEFVSGTENTADCMTRSLSYKQLMKTNFLTETSYSDMTVGQSRPDVLGVLIPNPNSDPSASFNAVNMNIVTQDHLIPLKNSLHFQS